MKKVLRWASFAAVTAMCAVFLYIFLTAIFSKAGDTVYVVSVSGNVVVGSVNDLSKTETAYVGMALTKGDLIATGDRSSCVLSYDKNAGNKSNYINVNKKSQIYLSDENQQGGYVFYLMDGSVICNMTNDTRAKTVISAREYNFFAKNTIAKVDYSYEEQSGKVFVFDGNPVIQIIQPSGSAGTAERLVKNSVCAVKSMDDGTTGFGCLNTGFGLTEFSAQDLKVMSGIANTWSEKLSYSMSEFEQAFQTASDKSDYIATSAVTLATTFEPTEIIYPSSSEIGFDPAEDDEPVVPEITESTQATGTVSFVSSSKVSREEPVENTAVDYVSEKTDEILSQVSLNNELASVGSNALSRYYGFSDENVSEYEAYVGISGDCADEFGIFVAKSDESAIRIKEALDERIASQKEFYRENKSDELYKFNDCFVIKVDKNVYYAVSGENYKFKNILDLWAYSSSASTTTVRTEQTTATAVTTTNTPYVVTPSSTKKTTPTSKETAAASTEKATTMRTTKAATTATTTVITSTTPVVKVDPDATFTVIFSCNEAGSDYWAMQLVKYGQSAIEPEPPVVPGKHFVKWDKDFSHVTSDMTVNALYEDGEVSAESSHVVNLYANNELFETVYVENGGSVNVAKTPVVDGKTFVGWSENLTGITQDITAIALFE